MADEPNAMSRGVSYRYDNLPLVEDENGNLRLGWPQVAVDAGHTLNKMSNALQSAFGARFAPEDAIPSQSDAGIAGLAMTGGGFGSLASKSLSGRALEDVAASNGLRSSPVEAGSEAASGSFPAYHGTDTPIEGQFRASRSGTMGQGVYVGAGPNGQAIGSAYARGKAGDFEGGNVLPLNVSAKVAPFEEFVARRKEYLSAGMDFKLANAAAQSDLAKSGYGAVATPEGKMVVFQPSTVKSALTGETLFSNPKEAAPVGATAGTTPMAQPNQQQAPNPDSFEAKLAQLHAVLVDLNGDGRLDAIAPAPNRGGGEQQWNARTPHRDSDAANIASWADNHAPHSAQQPPNAMAANGADSATPPPPNLMFPQMVADNPRGWGNGPPAAEEAPRPEPEAMSPGMAAIDLVRRKAPGQVQDFVEHLPQNLMTMAAGPIAGEAVGGIRAAMAARPALSAAVGGAGALLGGSSDAGDGQANLTKAQKRQMQMEHERNAMDTEAATARIEAETKAAKERGEAKAATDAKAAKDASDRAEYDSSVGRAEKARAFELSRSRRFSDTTVGKTMDALGGTAPILTGAVAGAIGRGASGPGGIVKDYVLPAAEGAIGGIASANVPLLYDAFYTEPDNPEKRAAEAYARELPPGHPRKQEFMDYAKSLPDKNPVREQAGKEFKEGAVERALFAGAEGAGAGVTGAGAVRIGGRMAGGVRDWLDGGPPQTPNAMTVAPSSGAPRPTLPHHSNFQPRNGNKFAGAPKYPKGDPRADD